MDFLNMSGNTLVSGGHGVRWESACTNAVVLKNDFSGATHRALAYDGSVGAVGTVSILKNTLNQGVSYHLKLAYPDSFGFFLQRNTYRHGSTNVNVFLDAASSPVHLVP